MLCGTCAQYGGVQLTGAALDVLHDIFEGGLNRALAAPVGPTTREVERLAVSVLEHHVERRLRSAALL